MVRMLEHFHEGRHEVPSDSHRASYFAVIDPEILAFDRNIIRPSGWRGWAALGFFLDRDDPQRKLADVMQQTTEVGLFLLEIVHLTGYTFAEQCEEKTVLTEGHELRARERLSGELHERTGKDKCAQPFRS